MNKEELINNFVNKWNIMLEPYIPNSETRKKIIIHFHDDCMHVIEKLINLTQKELQA